MIAGALSSGCSKSDDDSKESVKDQFGFDLSKVKVDLPKLYATARSEHSTGITDEIFKAGVKIPEDFKNKKLSYKWHLPKNAEFKQKSSKTNKDVAFSFKKAGNYLVKVDITDDNGNTAATGVKLLVSAPEKKNMVGNIAGKKTITEADAAILQAALDGTGKLDKTQLRAADINLDGHIDNIDLKLVQSAIKEKAAAPVYISTLKGSATSTAMVIHPELLDLSKHVSISLKPSKKGEWDKTCLKKIEGKQDWDTIPFNRAKPGYLVFSVPVKYSCLKTAETVDVVLNVKESDLKQHIINNKFKIDPLPKASSKQGKTVLEAMGRVRFGLEELYNITGNYADELKVSKDEKAVLQGLIKASSQSFNDFYGKFFTAFQMLDQPTRELWERLAKAQGINNSMMVDLRALTDGIKEASATGAFPKSALCNQDMLPADGNISEGLLEVICAYHKLSNIADKVASINEGIASALEWVDWWPLNKAPVVGQVISFISAASSITSMITGLIAKVGEYVPKLADKITVSVTPNMLTIGEVAVIDAVLAIQLSDLCKTKGGDIVSSIMESLQNYLTNQIASRIPYAGKAFAKAEYDTEKMNWIMSAVYKAINSVAGHVLKATKIDKFLNDLVNKMCSSITDPELKVDNASISAGCGTLSKNKWTCTETCGGFPNAMSTGFDAAQDFCEKTKKGSGAVACLGENPCGNGKIDQGEDCEKSAQCESSSPICSPACKCVKQNVCGNGVLEPANNEQCEKDGDCGVSPDGNKMNCEYCECKEVVCINDNDCVDQNSDDCSNVVCDTKSGKCKKTPKPYLSPCSTSKCIKNELCDTNGECKQGTAVVCDNPPEIAACYADNGTCNQNNGKCEYSLKNGASCASDSTCTGDATCNPSSCKCEGGSTTTCSCNTSGVSLAVASGCDNWSDATECSGWASVVEDNHSGQSQQDALAYEVASGTTLCGFSNSCCITLTCP